MSEQPVIIQKISWSDLCPWTIIFRTLPAATSVTIMSLALLGVVLMPVGWWISEIVFVNPDLKAEIGTLVDQNRNPYRGIFDQVSNKDDAIEIMGVPLSGPKAVFQRFVTPFSQLFTGGGGIRKFFYFSSGCLWTLAVWCFCGLGITRACLLRLTRNEQASLDETFEFALANWRTATGAVGIPLIAVALLCVPAFLVGLLMNFDIGVLVFGVLWIFVIGMAAVMAILLLGLLFGWPLMICSVGCEAQNSFDAMTRAYAYTFQRPLHYLFYAFLAILFGGLCWLVAGGIANGVTELSYWAVSWGMNISDPQRVGLIDGSVGLAGDNAESDALRNGRNMIELWNGLLRTIAVAFVYALFWCIASAIYLLLRRDVDEMEMDEIFVEGEQRKYELPPLETDERGIPIIQTPVPVEDGD